MAGPFQISLDRSRGCDGRKISRLTDRAAEQAGRDLDAYINRYYTAAWANGNCPIRTVLRGTVCGGNH